MLAYHIYIKLTDFCVKFTDVCYWYHLLKTLVWVLSIFTSSQDVFYMYKRGWSVHTAIYMYKLYFYHSLYVLWFWKIKTLFVLLSPDYVWSNLYKYITEPLLYPKCTRPTCLLLVFTVIKNFLTLAGEQYACLPYNYT